MENIYFKDLEELLNTTKYYSNGFESKLYRYIRNDNEVLIKKYYDKNQININKIKRVNKLKTEGLLKPKYLVNINNDIEGFAMDFIRGLYPLSIEKRNLTNEQKYNLIIKLKQILSSLKEEGCLYGDLNINNILTDGENVYLCDSVNVKIDEFNFDEISSTMNKYIEKTKTTEGLELYMLNLLTVYLFNEIDYNDVIESVELAVMSVFNKQPVENIIGVTDSLDTLNMCCDIFLSNKICDKTLIDYINIETLENNKVSRI